MFNWGSKKLLLVANFHIFSIFTSFMQKQINASLYWIKSKRSAEEKSIILYNVVEKVRETMKNYEKA